MACEKLVRSLRSSRFCIRSNFKSFPHELSIIHPDKASPPLNWLLGNMLLNRDKMLSYFGVEPFVPTSAASVYDEFDKKEFGTSAKIRFDELLELASSSGIALERIFQRLSPVNLKHKLGSQVPKSCEKTSSLSRSSSLSNPTLETWLGLCLLHEANCRRKLVLTKRKLKQKGSASPNAFSASILYTCSFS